MSKNRMRIKFMRKHILFYFAFFLTTFFLCTESSNYCDCKYSSTCPQIQFIYSTEYFTKVKKGFSFTRNRLFVF